MALFPGHWPEEGLRWLLPGVKTTGQKDKDFYQDLRKLVPLDARDTPGTVGRTERNPQLQQIREITDILSGRDPKAAGQMLMQAVYPQAGPNPTDASNEVQLLRYLQQNPGMVDTANLFDKGTTEYDALVNTPGAYETAQTNAFGRDQALAAQENAAAQALEAQRQEGRLGLGAQGDIAAQDLETQRQEGRLGLGAQGDAAAQALEAQRQEGRVALAGAKPPEDSAFIKGMQKGASDRVLAAEEAFSGGALAKSLGKIEQIDKILADPNFGDIFGLFGGRRHLATKTLLPGGNKDLLARINQIAGGEMLEAIQAFTGQISDKDLEWASKEMIDTITDPKVSPELAKETFERMRDILRAAVDDVQRYGSGNIRSMADYYKAQTSGLPKGWNIRQVP